jgi:hypothetical protein
MNYETNNHSSSPEIKFSHTYSEVIRDHPLIPVAIKALADKREQRASWRERGFFHDDHRDSTVDGFIGMGDEKTTLGVDNLAVKVLHENPQTHYTFEDQVAHLQRGEGVDGLEQLITGNKHENVIITTLMPGKGISSIPALQLARQVKPEHVTRLEATLSQMRERELEFDNVGNILFDPEHGFSIIDYRLITHDGSPIDAQNDPSTIARYRKRQNEMNVSMILDLAATIQERTSKIMMNGYGEYESTHRQRSALGKIALKAAFNRFTK